MKPSPSQLPKSKCSFFSSFAASLTKLSYSFWHTMLLNLNTPFEVKIFLVVGPYYYLTGFTTVRQFKLRVCMYVWIQVGEGKGERQKVCERNLPTTHAHVTSQNSSINRRGVLCYNINSWVVFAYSFNNNYWHCITHTNQMLLNLAKIHWKLSFMSNWSYYSRFYCNIYICSWCVSVGMQIRYMPCGQLDWDDSFLQHIFIWCLCEVQVHLNGLSFKYVQHESIIYYYSLPLVSSFIFSLLTVIFFFWICLKWSCSRRFYFVRASKCADIIPVIWTNYFEP